jgi:hypothetical protein
VNERVEELAARFGDDGATDWVCECADTGCTERVQMTMLEYEWLREDANRFAVKPGHEVPEVEDVTEWRERYVVVAKRGVGDVLVRQADPRAQPDDRF